eukprot:TRINITY_DN24563_c0_g1_i1.p1 TRINITY_DN24563_c0_g1~~TRINITY_DN24563_c0_g1_i1.p1  ORF type:complete len:195 (+),score=37.57 TRINITY_DN24563_c0_g1_i1:99-683(+)
MSAPPAVPYPPRDVLELRTQCGKGYIPGKADMISAVSKPRSEGPEMLDVMIEFGICLDGTDWMDTVIMFDAADCAARILSSGEAASPVSLAHAAAAECPNLTRLLLQLGLDPDHQEQGNSPLHAAASTGSLDCLTLLIEAGATLEARNALGLTPAHLAAVQSEDDCALALLRAGAVPGPEDFWTELLETMRVDN